jgi:predicted small secreted protein
MTLRWMRIVRVCAALLLGASSLGSTVACSTIEGVGKDISSLARAGKRAFD